MRYVLMVATVLAMAPALAPVQAMAQDESWVEEEAARAQAARRAQASRVDTAPGRVADSSAGQAGQRKTRDQLATGIAAPSGAISNRIQNRVQSRIRNRIDRFYDPQANAASPFRVAGERARTTARPIRR